MNALLAEDGILCMVRAWLVYGWRVVGAPSAIREAWVQSSCLIFKAHMSMQCKRRTHNIFVPATLVSM